MISLKHLLSFGILLVGICSYIVSALDPVNIKVMFDSEGSPSFSIYHTGESEWLRSGSVGIRAAGQWWSTSNKEKYLLKLTGHDSDTGKNIIGEFTAYK